MNISMTIKTKSISFIKWDTESLANDLKCVNALTKIIVAEIKSETAITI